MEINERDFFKNPFSRAEIEGLLQGRPASEAFSFRSPGFRELGVARESLADADLLELMAREPRFIRRPVVRIGGKVHFGADVKVLAELLK
jgi:arsenate reductase-like glutaredoxin family protein